ncbi:MAG: glycosyltransferase family 4 protein [Terrimicrobiaceae bacterium]
MKIGLIRRGFSHTGGAEAYLLRLAEGLATAGHAPVLVTSGDWPASAWSHGEMIRLPGSTPTEFARAFLETKNRFDVSLSLERTPGCDVFRAGDGVHAAWLKRRAAFEPAWKGFFRRWNPKHGALTMLERQVFENCRLIIANSRMVANEITEGFGVSPERIRVIPNGIGKPLPMIEKTEARKALGMDPNIFCALFVGTGWDRKGLALAVKAVDSLPGDSVLLVAGRGNPMAFQGRSTKFLGPTKNLPAIFAAADVFVLPTYYDPFSNACLEALAAGLPVVTTSANGCSGILVEGKHGNTVTPGHVEDLATALHSWKSAPRERVAADCRQLAAEYSLERNTEATIKVLLEVAAL